MITDEVEDIPFYRAFTTMAISTKKLADFGLDHHIQRRMSGEYLSRIFQILQDDFLNIFFGEKKKKKKITCNMLILFLLHLIKSYTKAILFTRFPK